MNQTTAVATQNGFPPRDGTLRRLTIHTDSVRADLVLPDSMPLELLLPEIVDIVSGKRGYQPTVTATRYQLSAVGDAALDQSKTLAQLRIRDGTSLLLTSSSTALVRPRLDDVAEAVSACIAATYLRSPLSTRLTAALAASVLVVVSIGVLFRNALDHADLRTGSVAVAAITAVACLLAACVAYRACRDTSSGLVLGLNGCGFAAVAGALGVPGDLCAPNALFATATLAASAGLMRAMGCHTVVFTGVTCFAATGAVAALAAVVTSLPLHVLGAASAAIALMLIEAAGPISIMLAGLSSQQDGQCVDPDALAARKRLNSMTVAFSATAMLGAIGASVNQHLPGILFAAVTAAVLLSRVRAIRDMAVAVPIIVCAAITTGAAFASAAVSYPAHSTALAVALIGVAGAVLRIGSTPGKQLSPIGRRGIELLEYLALAAVLPLACWSAGLYAAVRGLDFPWT